MSGGIHPLLHYVCGGGAACRNVLAAGVRALARASGIQGGEAAAAVRTVVGEKLRCLRSADFRRFRQAVEGTQGRQTLLGPLHVHQPHHLRRQLLGRLCLGCRGLLGTGRLRLLRIGGLGCGLLGAGTAGAAGDNRVHPAKDRSRLGAGHSVLSRKDAAVFAVQDAHGVGGGDRVPVIPGNGVPVPDFIVPVGGINVNALGDSHIHDNLSHVVAADLRRQVGELGHVCPFFQAVFLGDSPAGGVPCAGVGPLRSLEVRRIEGGGHHLQKLCPGEGIGGGVDGLAHAVDPPLLVGPLDVGAGPVGVRHVREGGRGKSGGRHAQQQRHRQERGSE